jgi:hypothetical protein
MGSQCQCCGENISNNDFPFCNECRFDDRAKLQGLYNKLGSWNKAEERLKQLGDKK